MECFYKDDHVGGADWDAGEVSCPFVAKYVSIRWRSGTGSAQFSFDGTTLHGYLSSDTDPDGTYPNEIVIKTEEGVSKIYTKNLAVHTSIRFWR